MTTFIDPKDIDNIKDERIKAQAKEMLRQFPHLAGQPTQQTMQPASMARDEDTLDYSNFGPQAISVPPPRERPAPPAMKIDATNHSFSGMEMDKDKEDQQEEAAPAPVKRKAGAFDPTGKEHPVLTKMRAALGMSTKKYYYDAEVGGSTYRMEALDGNSTTRAVVLAAMKSLNDIEYKLNVDTCMTAYSITHVDNILLADLFEVPAEEVDAAGNTIKRLHAERREVAVHLFYDFIKSAPPTLGETLEQKYRQEFPALDLMEGGKAFAHCPAPNCNYVRIVGVDAAYCPYHGEKLITEDSLPNPS